jgi:hypothetical protein
MLVRMRPALLIASPDAERRRRARALLADWPCYEAADPASLLRLLAAARPALLLLDADWPAGGAERAGLLHLRLDDQALLGLRARVAALLAAPPPALQ